uniref:type 2 DNA topoisomerase 6 subunit B-like n=1 Tax=Pristiophorus japonicus TaxID=55135 RepID=UPI00398EE8D4
MCCVTDLACPDISYTAQSILEDDWTDCGEAQEQVVLLFLFIKYWDDFHLELLDVIGGQQTVVEQLDQILHCNKDVVRESIQPVLHKVLDEYLQFKKNQKRMQTATSVICDAIQSILSSSTNRDFRTKSLQLLKVSNTQEMKTSLQNLLQNVIQNRFLLSRVCDTKRVHLGDGGHVQSNSDSATPETSQVNLYDKDSFQRIHTELEDSESDPPVDSDILCCSDESPHVTSETDFGFGNTEPRIGTRKRRLEACRMKCCTDQDSRPCNKTMNGADNHPGMENVSTDRVSLLQKDRQVSAPVPTRSPSEKAGYFEVQCSVMNTKQTITRKPTEDQEEHLWLQEVSNLSDWTH